MFTGRKPLFASTEWWTGMVIHGVFKAVKTFYVLVIASNFVLELDTNESTVAK